MKLFKCILMTLVLNTTSTHAQLTFNILDFGAIGNGSTLNTSAIQQAIDSCNASGGGDVIVPSGTFLTGTLFLKSNVYLRIERNGTLKGSGEPADYPEIQSPIPGMADSYRKRSLLYAYNQENIGLKGDGIFDGNSFAIPFVINSDQRVFGTRFISCKNVLYENLTMRNTSFWMMHNLDCDSVIIRNINLINQGAGNNDGIGIDACRRVKIHDCNVDSYNDAVVMKTTINRPMYDVEVYNCTLASAARVIKIGTETVGNVSKIHVHDCIVRQGSLTAAEIGINLGSIDGSHIDSVMIENIDMSGVLVPIVVRLGDSDRLYLDSLPSLPAGSFSSLTLRNINAIGQDEIPCHITGIPAHPLQNIRLENITLSMKGGKSTFDPGILIPENINQRPEHDLFGNILPAHGIYFRHIDGLVLDDVCVSIAQPDARPSFWFDDVNVTDTSALCSSLNVSEHSAQSLLVEYNLQEQYLKILSQNAGRVQLFDLCGKLVHDMEIMPGETMIPGLSFPLTYSFYDLGNRPVSGICRRLRF
jgi:hypothetical protein